MKKFLYLFTSPFIFLLMVAASQASNMYEYSLFSGVLHVVLPHDPQRINTGVYGVEMYAAADKADNIVYTVRSTPTDLEHDIGAYNSDFKQTLDQLLTMPARFDNQTLVSFSSNFDRNSNKYFAEMTTWYIQDGIKRYRSVKRIIYKKKIYDWTVMYPSLSEKNYVFDGFKQYVRTN